MGNSRPQKQTNLQQQLSSIKISSDTIVLLSQRQPNSVCDLSKPKLASEPVSGKSLLYLCIRNRFHEFGETYFNVAFTSKTGRFKE